MTPDLIIFDCDGVLIDSEILACAVDAEKLTEQGFEITTEEVARRFAGVPSIDVYEVVEAEIGRPLPGDFEDMVDRHILASYRDRLQPIPGVHTVMSELTTRCCVASNSRPAKLMLGLVETDLIDHVYPHIFSSVLVEKGKPAPDLFLFAARQMGVDPSRCVVIEDSIAGVTGAVAAGMPVIGFPGASHCQDGHDQRLLDVGARAILPRFEDLHATIAALD